MSKLLTAAFVALLVLSFACKDDGEVEVLPSPEVTTSPTDTGAAGASPTPTPEDGDDLGVCLDNPDPATSEVVIVDEPSADDAVTSPLTVSGQFAAFEAQFNITIFDAAGNPIVDVSAMTAEGQVLSPFSEDVEFDVDEETPACLWVHQLSARDGLPSQVVQVPLTLLP